MKSVIPQLLLSLVVLGACDESRTAGTAPSVASTSAAVSVRPPQRPSPATAPRASKMARMNQLTEWIRGAYPSGDPEGPQPKSDEVLLALGKRVFLELCSACHGESGDGKGPEASKLGRPPRDFRKAVYKLRSTPSGKLPRDEDLFRTISRGMHGTAMLPFVPLPEHERWALVAHLETLSPRFANEKRAAAVSVPTPPEPTAALVERGRALFREQACIDCHGAAGKGDGKRSAELKDAEGRTIVPRDFTQGRFLRGTTMRELYLTLRTGLDGTPMAAFDALDETDTWALAAFVRTLVSDPIHRQDNPPVHPEERLGLRIDMRAIMMHR